MTCGEVNSKEIKKRFVCLVDEPKPTMLDKDDPGLPDDAFDKLALIKSSNNLLARLSEVAKKTMAFKNAEQIAEFYAGKYGMTIKEMFGERRTHAHLKARLEALEAINEKYPDWSTPRIGRFMNKDHSTVVYNLQKIKSLKLNGEWPPQ